MQSERYPVPFGWVKEFDQTSGHPFYVDTKASPPRSIWTHPYEDGEFLKAHPDVRGKLNASGSGSFDPSLPPPSFEESQRRHSYGGQSSSSRPDMSSSTRPQSTSIPAADSKKRKDRSFLGKLKDKTIGTKEEREAESRRRHEMDRIRMEAQRQRTQEMMIARQQLYASQPQYHQGPTAMGFPYGGGYGSQRQRRGGGMGGLALPLLGGLAGGFLLGEALDGGFGGGFDGGGFDGGGFDGGGF